MLDFTMSGNRTAVPISDELIAADISAVVPVPDFTMLNDWIPDPIIDF